MTTRTIPDLPITFCFILLLGFIPIANVNSSGKNHFDDWLFDCSAQSSPTDFNKGSKGLYYSDKYVVAKTEVTKEQPNGKYAFTLTLGEQMKCEQRPRKNDYSSCRENNAPYFSMQVSAYDEANFEEEENIVFASLKEDGTLQDDNIWITLDPSICIRRECPDDVSAVSWNAWTWFGEFQKHNNIVIQSYRNKFSTLLWQDESLFSDIRGLKAAYISRCGVK